MADENEKQAKPQTWSQAAGVVGFGLVLASGVVALVSGVASPPSAARAGVAPAPAAEVSLVEAETGGHGAADDAGAVLRPEGGEVAGR